MKRRYIVLLVILEIVIIILMGFFPNKNPIITTQFIKTSSTNDLVYTFEENEFGNGTLEYKNLKHYNNLTGIYNASYSFQSDTIGGNPIGWNIDEAGGTVNVISELDQHDKVLALHDYNGGANVDADNSFTAQVSGTYEFWFRTNDATDGTFIRGYDGATLAINFWIQNDVFIIGETGGDTNVLKASDDIWYHIRIDFDCTSDTLDIYIDGLDHGNYDFKNVATNLDKLWLLTSTTDSNYYSYFDAIGYDWLANYTTDENRNPTIENIDSQLLTNDRYEFNIDKNDKPIAYDNIDSSPSDLVDWVTTGSDVGICNGHDIANLFPGYNYFDYDDNFVYVWSDVNSYRGIYNDSMNIQGINYEINFTAFTHTSTTQNSGNMVIFNLYGLNGSKAISWRLQDSNTTNGRMNFQYFNGIIWTTEGAFDGFDNDYTIWEFNLDSIHIGSNHYQYRINFYRNNSLIYTSFYHNFIEDITGISKLELYLRSPITVPFRWFFPYISIRNHGISICNEKGYIKTSTNYYTADIWNPERSNVIILENINYANCFIYGYASIGGWQRYFITNTTQEDFTKNVYLGVNPYWSFLTYASFYAINTQYINSSFEGSISGVYLEENSNSYYPTYFYGNVNANNSYFYVSNSRLKFTCLFDEDNTFEYMLITFTLDSFNSINRSIYTTTYYNSMGDSYVWVNYTSSLIGVYEVQSYPNAISQILPQDRTVIGISLDVTDSNSNYITNRTSSGYIGDIAFVYNPDITTDITTYNLISAIIPFMIIFFPSIAVYVPMRKKQIGGIAFIIMFAALSLVCFASGLIPLWVLFVLIYALGFFFVISRRRTAF